MKIIIPVLGFGKSGGNRVLSKLADELIKLGHEVSFLSPSNCDEPYFPTLANILWIDKKGNIVNSRTLTEKSPGFFSNLLRLTKGLKKLPADGFDIVLANHSITTIPVKLAGLLKKTVYYVQAYEPEYYNYLPGFRNKILKLISRYSYTLPIFTIVNAEVYTSYKNIRSNRVLYPGIDFNYFYPKKTEKTSTEKIVIGTVGRMEKYKGTHHVLEAFNSIKKQFKHVELLVAFGSPTDFIGINGVTCVFPDGDEALGNYYRSLDYYFCAGNIQLRAFHYPVAEALSCAVPVITTNYFPASEKNSWIVDPGNAGFLVEAFHNSLHNNEETRKKIDCGILDMQDFDWKQVGEKMDRFLLEFVKLNQI
ncbi:MAG TPA: glycosyltransferase family 4 protein [Ferruginibacter sp.]|nr:glycosyltransferase family 4 protein [Ferruginibacter sp.]HRE62402.1 glycosyltransferase family 4 protein [Ferruginibacter sp.]